MLLHILMAFSILTAPDALALTKGGRASYVFQGNAALSVPGAASVSGIVVSGPIPDGAVIVLKWNGIARTFTARSSPALPGEFLAGNGSSGYVDSLAEFFRSNFYIREDFTVSRDSLGGYQSVIFTARTTGTLYDITGTVSGTSNAFVSIAVAGVTPITKDRYGVYVELKKLRAGQVLASPVDETQFQPIYTGLVEADQNGQAFFDAGAILHNELAPDLALWNGNTSLTATQSTIVYLVCYAEAYGSPPVIGQVQTDTVRRAYLGGADFQSKAGGYQLSQKLRGIQASQDKALRFGPRMRYTLLNEPQWLTFVNQRTAVTAAGLSILMLYDDNTSELKTDILPTRSFAAGAKITFACGIGQLNLLELVPAGKHLKEYQVQLVAGSDALSVTYRFVLNYAYQPYARFLSYLNSLGAIDTLTTYGKGSQELQLFAEQAERYLPASYDPLEGQYVDFDLAIQQSTSVTTGFKSAAELRRWKDLYRSPVKFLHNSLPAKPIGLVSKSIKQAKDGDNQFAHSFDFVDLYRDEYYTSDDSDEFDPQPPMYFVPAGQVVINTGSGGGTGGSSVDPTVPDGIRDVTPEQIAQWNLAYAWGNHGSAGYLTRQIADGLYALKTDIPNAQAIANTYLRKDELSWDKTAQGGSVPLLADMPGEKELAVWTVINDVRVLRRLSVSSLPVTFLTGEGEPDAELGEVNYAYFDTENKLFYGPKTADGWGDGISLKGDPGSSLIAGTADPNPGDGELDDWWLNKTTKTLFGPKTNSGWGAGVLLTGDAPKWHFGLGNPSPLLGTNGDCYLASTGQVWQKENGNWLVKTTLNLPETTPGTGSGHYTHIQSSPAADWYVEHNLGYYAAGFVVKDSGGNEWEPEVEYIDTNNLILRFGISAFTGTSIYLLTPYHHG